MDDRSNAERAQREDVVSNDTVPGGARPDDSDPSDGVPTAAGRVDGGPDAVDDSRLQVKPLPYDGVLSVAVGTGLWLVALLAMLPFTDDLDADGHLWWVATAAVGFGLGLLGLRTVVRRRNRLRAASSTAPPS